jgi:SPP1 gp7 family putative phage head morphogenesis protein
MAKKTDREEQAEVKPAKKEAPAVGRDTATEDAPPGARPRSNEDKKNLVVDLYTGTAERTVDESSWVWKSQIKPYNPDDLVRKTGDYKIYEEMLQDDQVSVCITLKRDLVVGAGWGIEAGVPDDSQDELVKDLKRALEDDLEEKFDDILNQLLTDDAFGFSMSEKIFKHRDDGSLTLKNVKTRHPGTWLIHTDEKGNVTKLEQGGRGGSIYPPYESMIHRKNRPLWQNPYGTSDLRAAYNAYFIKRQVVKWYAMFLEKAASPTPVGRYDAGITDDVIDTLYNALKRLQTSTAMMIPKTVELDFLESKSNGEAYEKALNILNMFIGRALLIPDLLGFQGGETGGGSYSLGKDQIAVFFRHINGRRRSLEADVNRHLMYPMVVYNHGFVEDCPKFKLAPISDEQIVELAKAWCDAVKGKLWKPSDQEINHFRRIAKFPEGDVEREAAPTAIDPVTGKPLPPPKPGEEGEKPEAKEKPGKTEPEPKDEKKEFSYDDLPHAELKGGYDRKTDYGALANTMERFKLRVIEEARPVIRRVYENLYDQIEAKKILQTGNIDKVEAIKLKGLNDVRHVLKSALRDGWKVGRDMGIREILKGQFRAPIPDDKFLEFIEKESYQYVGDWAYEITKKARIKLQEAIRDGKPLSAVIDVLDAEGFTDSMTSVERYARTKFTDVMNRGRLAAFNDSGVVAAYQYSAILDDRTTPICAGLHGKIFRAGSEPVPPMHWNCRSLLVPITKYESFDVDDEVGGQDINDFIEENKGDGFAKR